MVSPPLWDTMGTGKWTEGDPFFSVQYDGYKPDYWSRSICHQSRLWYAHNMMSCAMKICSAVVDV